MIFMTKKDKEKKLKKKKQLFRKKKLTIEKNKKEEEKVKAREVQIKREEEEEKKRREEITKGIKQIEEFEDNISEKTGKVVKLREKIEEAQDDKDSIAGEILSIENNIQGLKNEKNILFKIYNEGLANKKQIAEEHNNRLAEWKARHDAKLKEKAQVKREVKQKYENELNELENELRGLRGKERSEQEKWKKLELKAKYKLEENEREKSIREEIKILQSERKDIGKDYKDKVMELGKDISGKDFLQKQKDLDDHIRKHKKSINELNKRAEGKEIALKRYNNRIEKLLEDEEKAKKQLKDYRRYLGSISLITSFFKFKNKEGEEITIETKETVKKKEAEGGKREIMIKRKDKSRLFVKCHKLLLKAGNELQNNNIAKANKLYLKTRGLYIKLEYLEKKEIYHELTDLYNNLKG